ncbi:hypothetical protein TrLO_g13861 [Triparma laevis f. longispina]|uniref:Uncharacterized protein n=1 Tax=Triparma laevis f. longispina TaxID=1714387 RepID=A0A9W7AL23_9STRA|nr:hypothetical protein TrLO_g13861 [Triparma laevis f. longispina]
MANTVKAGKKLMEDQKAVFASCESMRISKEQGNPAQLELREKARVNENTISMVKKMPFVLNNREFVFRQIWKSEEGKVFPQALGAGPARRRNVC